MQQQDKVLFDPGFAPLVIESLQQAGYTYYTFTVISSNKLKKLSFPNMFRKMEKYIKTNISFYLGCLLWGTYIANGRELEIEGNKLLGEECSQDEYTNEINFLIDYISTILPRDCKYFLNKQVELDKRYIPILQAYKEFLILNKGFCFCSKTSQIILPKTLRKVNQEQLELINQKIQKAINDKQVEQLLDCYDILF